MNSVTLRMEETLTPNPTWIPAPPGGEEWLKMLVEGGGGEKGCREGPEECGGLGTPTREMGTA